MDFKNSSFQRLQNVHTSLDRFNPSGGPFGMGCRTRTYFSRTINDFTSKSRFSPNLCSIVISPDVNEACESDGKNWSARTEGLAQKFT